MVLLSTSCISEKRSDTPFTRKSDLFSDPPQWANEVVWYQIMVERFNNGDLSNDPSIDDIKEGYPGFAPDSWKVTPWTQDWYKEDPYFQQVYGQMDLQGNVMNDFMQVSRLRRFGGDLQGVIDKIDYMDSLGVSAIYFNPLNDAPSYHKYDAAHWRHIDRNFGPSPSEDLHIMSQEIPDDPSTWQMTGADQMFVEAINLFHERGIRIILDYSWNHTGNTFWALKDIVQNGSESKYKDWYWIHSFDDPSTEENELDYQGWMGVVDLAEIKETYKHDPASPLAAYESDIFSKEAKDHIFNITRKWLDPDGDGDPSDGVDGFRLDVAAEIGLEFWRQYRTMVREIKPDAYLLGEVWWAKWPDRLLDPEPFLKGDVFDAVMNYRWYRTARHFFAAAPDPIPVSEFVDSLRSLTDNLREQNNFAMMNLVASHDSPRVLTSLYNKNKYKYHVQPSPDNDYKINKPDVQTYQTLKLLLVHQYTYIGAPHIWAGDEMGMWGADFTRKPLIWPELNFHKEKLHPYGFEKPADEIEFDSSLFSFYQDLIHIRKDHPVLSHGAIDYVIINDDQNILAYSRYSEHQEAIVLFNVSDEPHTVSIPIRFDAKYTDIFGNLDITRDRSTVLINIEPREAAIIMSKG